MTPPQTNSQTSIHTQGNNPRLLRIYVGYRLLLSVLFLTLVQLQWAPHYLGSDNHQLFSLTIIIYTVANLVTAALFHWSNWKPGETAVFAMLLIDTLAITLIMHASGSLDGSLGYLLMVTVAASGMFQRSILALALAAIASIILVSLAVTSFWYGNGDEATVIRSGIFGTLLFATAVLFIFLAKRLSAVQQLALSESRMARPSKSSINV